MKLTTTQAAALLSLPSTRIISGGRVTSDAEAGTAEHERAEAILPAITSGWAFLPTPPAEWEPEDKWDSLPLRAAVRAA